MGYQFMRMSCYARKAGKGKEGKHTIRSILAEAKREADACPHVKNPQEPLLIFGRPLDDVEAEAVEWAEHSVDAIGRKLRKDGLCLLSGVVSAPDDMTDKQWTDMKRDVIEWLNRDERLAAVVEHLDESHRHIHFYKIPAPGERFEVLHPGRAAALAAKAEGKLKGDQNKAYRAAMRGLQDDFYMEIGVRYGLTRLGPGKRRLTRPEWRANEAEAKAIAKAIETADAMTAAAEAKAKAVEDMATAYLEKAGQAKAASEKAKAEALAAAATAKAEADKADEQRKKALEAYHANKALVEKENKRREAEKRAMEHIASRIAAERAELEAAKAAGGRLGAAFSGFTGFFTGRKAKDQDMLSKLKAVTLEAETERKRADKEEERAKRNSWTIKAVEERAAKQIRKLEEENEKVRQMLASLSAAKAQQAARGPRL